jgi:hypothetical protein
MVKRNLGVWTAALVALSTAGAVAQDTVSAGAARTPDSYAERLDRSELTLGATGYSFGGIVPGASIGFGIPVTTSADTRTRFLLGGHFDLWVSDGVAVAGLIATAAVKQRVGIIDLKAGMGFGRLGVSAGGLSGGGWIFTIEPAIALVLGGNTTIGLEPRFAFNDGAAFIPQMTFTFGL